MQQGFFSVQQTCPRCRGTGKQIKDPCNTCHGRGTTDERKTLSVKVPAGVDIGDRIRLAGEGQLDVTSFGGKVVGGLLELTREHGIPFQAKVVGRDTGTDAMASVLSGIDSAATSIGFPIRNMHTISESGHTGDVLGSIHSTFRVLQHLDGMNGGKGATAEERAAEPAAQLCQRIG